MPNSKINKYLYDMHGIIEVTLRMKVFADNFEIFVEIPTGSPNLPS